MRLAAFSAASFAAAIFVVLRSLAARAFQFFPAMVHLSKSGGSVLVLLAAAFAVGINAGRRAVRAVFGPLRAVEVEHLYERSWFAVTETCLAMTVFRDEFGAEFVLFFGVLLGAKVLHWIAGDRVDFMEQGPAPTLRSHLKMLPTMFLLLAFDLYMLSRAVDRTLKRGPSAVIVFGFEYTILAAQIAATLVKYALHTVDLRDDQPWEDKGMIIFYLDLIVGWFGPAVEVTCPPSPDLQTPPDFCKLVAYFLFFALVVHFYGLPLHIVRDLYFTLRSFASRVRDLLRYRRATANMDVRYPDATAAELAASDGVCIICREEMTAAEPGAPQRPDRPKRLPCGHMFHFHCLRSWLERQQSCPTCRRSVLVDAPPPAAAPGQPAPQPAARFPLNLGGLFGAPPAAAPPPAAAQPPPAPFPFAWPMPPAIPIPADRLPPGWRPPQAQGVFPIPGMQPLAPGDLPPGLVPGGLPGFGGLAPPPAPAPAPTIPDDLDSLTDAQLVRLDERARAGIKARLREAREIEEQLFGLIARMTALSSADTVDGAAREGAASASGAVEGTSAGEASGSRG
ncbi:hypothetical protein DFJ74DRAFT_475618 [Hyaloraphidium curvatum]|nr:hypothetical protein DFJ74DRAFT_475618 [Hyaloraphidium curvatum]